MPKFREKYLPVTSGNSREKAEQFVDFSDMRNVRLCLEHSKKADLELFLDSDNNYATRENT